MGKTSVLITTEGTYPCYSGGVSVWCDYLIRGLADVDFHVLALNHAPGQPMKFPLPENVQSCRLHAIWGTEVPGSTDDQVAHSYMRRERTTPVQIRKHFVPHFRAAAQVLLSPGQRSHAGSEHLAAAFLGIHRFCYQHDYAIAAASRDAWETFLSVVEQSELALTLDEATQCMRWMQRNLSLLSLEHPPVDIVHSSIAGLAGIPGVLCKLAHNSSYLLTEHGLHLRELQISLAQAPYSKACRQFLLNFHQAITRMNYYFADTIAALGEFSREWQVRLGANPSKITIVPNGIDPARYFPGPPGPQSRPTIVTMARISPIKGIETLVRAAALIREEVPDVRIRIMGEVGDSSYHRHCVRLTEELDLNSTVEFGSTQDGAAVYREADVFCLASLSEGMPFAVIEAMMSGCPVVATNVGSVGDMLQGCGVLIRPNSPTALAAALVRLLREPEGATERATMAARARKRAMESFTVASFTERNRTMYSELLYASARLSRAAV